MRLTIIHNIRHRIQKVTVFDIGRKLFQRGFGFGAKCQIDIVFSEFFNAFWQRSIKFTNHIITVTRHARALGRRPAPVFNIKQASGQTGDAIPGQIVQPTLRSVATLKSGFNTYMGQGFFHGLRQLRFNRRLFIGFTQRINPLQNLLTAR